MFTSITTHQLVITTNGNGYVTECWALRDTRVTVLSRTWTEAFPFHLVAQKPATVSIHIRATR